MTAMPESDERIAISFVRQPSEHIAVMQETGRRFTARRAVSRYGKLGWALLLAIGCGAGVPALFYFLRNDLFIPIFELPASIDTGDIAFIWLVPTLILYVVLVPYFRWLAARRLAAMQSRIRPNITITVVITPEGASWNTQASSMWLAWSEIQDIGRRNDRIEFDLESFVTYIPVSAFADQAEQDAAFARILGFWRAANPVQP